MTRRPLRPIAEKGRLIDPTPRKTFADRLEDFCSTIFIATFWLSMYPVGRLFAYLYDRKKDKT